MDLIPNFAMETWVLVATSLVLLYMVFGNLTENVMKNMEKCGAFRSNGISEKCLKFC
ncbi:CYP3A43 isoform 4 [Pongo abelii]|uniref:CYP3A43 isoform 4 n=1 Tax=Pongo abelii TaxID=9601 RepID=A0A2J8RUG1_PONAB|nr:CYP3A43 isoform 4 [Pongo abelii]